MTRRNSINVALKSMKNNHFKKTFNFCFCLFCIIVGCAPTKTVYCPPDRTPVIVLKKPENAYPVYAKEFDSSIKMTLEILNKVKPTTEVSLKNKIVELRNKLDQESIRMEVLVKTYYLVFNSRPCDQVVRDKFYDFLDEIARKNYELEKLRLELMNINQGKFRATEDTKIEKIKNTINTFEQNYLFLNSQN
jgi:hypothetical protein